MTFFNEATQNARITLAKQINEGKIKLNSTIIKALLFDYFRFNKIDVCFSMPIKDFGYLKVCIHGINTHWVNINYWNAFIKAFEKFVSNTPKGT